MDVLAEVEPSFLAAAQRGGGNETAGLRGNPLESGFVARWVELKFAIDGEADGAVIEVQQTAHAVSRLPHFTERLRPLMPLSSLKPRQFPCHLNVIHNRKPLNLL